MQIVQVHEVERGERGAIAKFVRRIQAKTEESFARKPISPDLLVGGARNNTRSLAGPTLGASDPKLGLMTTLM